MWARAIGENRSPSVKEGFLREIDDAIEAWHQGRGREEALLDHLRKTFPACPWTPEQWEDYFATETIPVAKTIIG
jgi:hypothetical protein